MKPSQFNFEHDLRQSSVDEFQENYGIDHGSAGRMVQGAFQTMVEHMYGKAMEELRECAPDEFVGIQAQAQLLHRFIGMKDEIQRMDE